MIKLKPNELGDIKYWIHLGVIAIVVLGILQLVKGGEMFTIKNILWSIPLLACGDIAAHTLLKLN